MKIIFTKKTRRALAAFILFTSVFSSYGQIENNTINYEVKPYYFYFEGDTEIGTEEGIFKVKSWDLTIGEWNDYYDMARYFPDGIYIVEESNPDTWLFGITGSDYDTHYDLELYVFEDDGGDFLTYDDGDDNLYEANAGWNDGLDYTTITDEGDRKPSRWYSNHNFSNDDWLFPFSQPWNLQIRTAWRYSHGDNCGDPLKFGSLLANTTVDHFNTNKTDIIDEAGGVISIIYTNYEGEPSSDVYYSFTISEPLEVTISTVNAATNFDTYLKLWDNTGDCTDFSDLITSNNNTEGTLQSKIVRVLEAGTYIVMVEGAGSAEGDFELTIETGVSTASLSTESITSFAVYPNPATSVIQITFDNQGYDQSTIRIVNALGEVVASEKNNGQMLLSISTENLAQGIYTVMVLNNGKTETRKLVIQ